MFGMNHRARLDSMAARHDGEYGAVSLVVDGYRTGSGASTP
jgi:hypothetical protein